MYLFLYFIFIYFCVGLVTNLHDQHIIKVCLGKAHCVVLNTKGELFSFGLNNKYQCGHLFKGSFVSENIAQEKILMKIIF
jgi:alpha-tubulin suppressor-like RCC1 family protein